MDKVLIVAKTEFATAVRSKGFLASLLMLPLIYGLMISVQVFAQKADVEPRKFAVVDHTGKLFPAIQVAAREYNKATMKDGKPVKPAFLPEEYKIDGKEEGQILLDLSDRVRAKDLYAFVEIPAEIIEAKAGDPIKLKYHTLNPNYRELPAWIDAVVGIGARTLRFNAVGVNPLLITKIDRPIQSESLGLVTRATGAASTPSKDGKSSGTGSGPAIVEAKKNDPVRTYGVPFVLSFLIFIVTTNVGPQLMTTVMEEKLSRISEMLLSSLSSFQLMLGKLIGNALTAMVSMTLYLSAGYAAASKFGYADAVTPGLIATLLLFVFLAIFLFGSLYMAVGSACNDMKDAQSMMMPVLMLSFIPMAFQFVVISNPSSNIAVAVSMFPFATPMLMTMRMAMSPEPPVWQVLTSIVMTTATAIACVWASAKIFRTGLLMHGKAPSIREMVKWVLAK